MNKLDILRYISNNNFIKIYKNNLNNYSKKNKIEDIFNKILYFWFIRNVIRSNFLYFIN